MKALQFRNGHLDLTETSRPEPLGEALIRVTCSGICNTDLEIVRGYAGFEGTIGHEFVGVVEASDKRPDLIGKRVVGEINAGCGKCALCLAGDPRHCRGRTVLGIKGRDGAHAEFLRLPAANLLEVPDSVTDDEAVFVEPLAAALGVSERADIGPDTKVAVLGDGKLGLLCAFAMSTLTRNTSLIGKHTSKLNIAVGYDIDALKVSEIAHLNSRFDVVIEASGSESGFASALDLVRPRGTIVLKSTFSGKLVW
ncbi:alcohol dehydrogenase catalytic domain-containing protein [soil metagenome]